MKSRIGTINKKPIVQGDKNLVTPNEIHVSELKGGEQSNIPVEYYKVVALEGEDLKSTRLNMLTLMAEITSDKLSCFHVVVKGTSSVNGFKLFAGLPLSSVLTFESANIHAYAIRSFKVICKVVNQDGTITESPNFNSMHDFLELFGQNEEGLFFKKHLVPITAEEFYNLDDLK